MVIAVSVVRVMKVAIHEIVQVISVGHALMTSAWPVNMFGLMRGAVMLGSTSVRVFFSDSDRVVVDMVSVYVMQVAVVKIVSMAIVLYSRVATRRAVGVRMSFMFRTGLRAHL